MSTTQRIAVFVGTLVGHSTGVVRPREDPMTSEEPHRRQPTYEEKFAAAGAEDYLGVPISDEELADVWTSTPTEDEPPA